MICNDELVALCKLAQEAGARLTIHGDARFFREEGGVIIESVTVHSGIPGFGPYPMGAIAAAERLREARAKGLLAPVIVSAEIGPMPRVGMHDPLPTVRALFADGQTRRLFQFRPDEIMFAPEDFIGLTYDAACKLRFVRDVVGLRNDSAARRERVRDV